MNHSSDRIDVSSSFIFPPFFHILDLKNYRNKQYKYLNRNIEIELTTLYLKNLISLIFL